ncbi:unnamed protein product [Polarella glacialis]|uniref:BD-FAE-like domain-containing protein n=1 Tax=Polarella glacialis TaxID=89957 RepID=A0A813EQ50_POLGL|nr:unnamed protein product [Polarella glacialis]
MRSVRPSKMPSKVNVAADGHDGHDSINNNSNNNNDSDKDTNNNTNDRPGQHRICGRRRRRALLRQSLLRRWQPLSPHDTLTLGSFSQVRVEGHSAEPVAVQPVLLEFLTGAMELTVRLSRLLRYAVVFAWSLLRLMAYVGLLLPAFLCLGWQYFHDSRIRRGLRYGAQPRNFLDLYCPAEAQAAAAGAGPPVPVVVAVMGGAWVIGHRLRNVQLASRLAEAGVLVVAVDYRNYPMGELSEMVEDVSQGMDWVFVNIASYGGDPNNVVMVGQSAGAHISSMLLLQRALEEVSEVKQACGKDLEQDNNNINNNNDNDNNNNNGHLAHRWSVSDLKGYLGMSGVYDLAALELHMESIGVYPFLSSFCAGGDLIASSPTHQLQSASWRGVLGARAAARMPPVHLFHGQADTSVPTSSTLCFAENLRAVGVRSVKAELRPGVTHSEPIIEGPLGGYHYQVQLLLRYLLGHEGAQERLNAMPKAEPMVPASVLRLAAMLMPF